MVTSSHGDGHRFDWREYERPSVAIATAVATVTDRDPMALDAIFDVIDPGAVNALLDGSAPDIEISFHYEGCHISIHADGTLIVTRR